MKNNSEGKCITKLVTTLLYLRKVKTNKKTGLAPIYLRITLDGDRSEMSLKRKVHPNDWDSNNQKVRGKGQDTQVLNAYLTKKKDDAVKYYTLQCLAENEVTSKSIVEKIKGRKKKKATLLGLYDQFIVDFEEQVEAGDRAQSRLEKHGYCIKKINKFLSHRKIQDVELESLELNFITGLHNYIRKEDSLSYNTAVGYCKMVKAVLNFGVKNRVIDTSPFISYNKNYIDKPRVYLSQEEIKRIEDKQFGSKNLQQVKDLFLFSIYSGIAYIDAVNLSSKNLIKDEHGKDWLEFTRQKTNRFVSIPLLSDANKILNKYQAYSLSVSGKSLIPTYSNQHSNRLLKLISAHCQIDKDITTHSGRHTYASTTALANNVPLEVIGELLGHADVRTTKVYAKYSKHVMSEVATRLDESILMKKEKLGKVSNGLEGFTIHD